MHVASGCLQPCREDTFAIGLGTPYTRPKTPLAKNHTHLIHLYVSKPVFTTETEFWYFLRLLLKNLGNLGVRRNVFSRIYDRSAFLADVGGMGGMILGVSILGTYDWILDFVRFPAKKSK